MLISLISKYTGVNIMKTCKSLIAIAIGMSISSLAFASTSNIKIHQVEKLFGPKQSKVQGTEPVLARSQQ